jgi:hypothetical protein
MSEPIKSRGGQASELTRLKHLHPDKRELVWGMRSETADGRPVAGPEDKPATNTQIRNRIAKQFGIRLSRDGQLSEFWRWYADQAALDSTSDLIEQFEEFTRSRNPGMSADKVRQMGIEFFMAHTMAKKDANKFATIVTLDQNERFGKTRAAQKDRELALKERKLVMDEAKSKVREALDGVGKGKTGKLDAATKKEILDAIDKKLLGEA